jgi:hypothetical protein
MKIYRWHISRKFDEPQADAEMEAAVDVIVTPAADRFPISFFEESPRAILDLPPEELNWWQIGDEFELEGTTSERAMIEVLATKNLFPEATAPASPAIERQIVEDMVFLQVVKDEDLYRKMWGSKKEARDWSDLTDLVSFDQAQWIDFTQSSRKMAKELYRKALGEVEEPGGEEYAAK